MLNRRQALLAGTAFAGASRLVAGEPDSVDRKQHCIADLDDAQIFAECSALCSEHADRLNLQSKTAPSEGGGLIGALNNCAQLCSVISVLVVNRLPLSPAISQACADACSRVLPFMTMSGGIDNHRNTARVADCMKLCRQLAAAT
ncbi:MAG: hypothetical protein R3C49_25685 [Planctomycetaceae bacterium]